MSFVQSHLSSLLVHYSERQEKHLQKLQCFGLPGGCGSALPVLWWSSVSANNLRKDRFTRDRLFIASAHAERSVLTRSPLQEEPQGVPGSTKSDLVESSSDVAKSGQVLPHGIAGNRTPPPHKKPEVLAPAGGWPQLRAAVENGADAVYFGLSSFNARARAANFAPEELEEVLMPALTFMIKCLVSPQIATLLACFWSRPGWCCSFF